MYVVDAMEKYKNFIHEHIEKKLEKDTSFLNKRQNANENFASKSRKSIEILFKKYFFLQFLMVKNFIQEAF